MLPRVAVALLIVTVVSGSASLSASEGEPDEAARPLRADSSAPYVHRLTLYDHDGVVIDPEDEFAGPYSPRTTCAKCHDYGEISRGWHFGAGEPGIHPGRTGEPWLLVDPQTGTVLPISGRGWPGTFKPDDIGLSNWDFVLRFGRHLPGGGFGEPNSEPEALRWNVSGHLEIDCMFCHSTDQQHDPAEAARQIESENFRWAPTAALGLAVVRGEARRAPDDWDPLMPPDPDFPERAGPRLVWDQSRFDPDNRVLFNITRRPPNDRCYFCHSFHEVGPTAPARHQIGQDVHLAAGLLCVDCHRNGLDHMMVRGYRTEAQERVEPALAAFSCEGCHLGAKDANGAEIRLGGAYGAPHPQHKGLPPHHFERLTCTACHSGPWPELNARRFQTALAHGLGLATRERGDNDPPQIVGPVFVRQHDGKIAPQWMVWPAFWTRFHLGRFFPILLSDVQKAVRQATPVRFGEAAAQAGPLTSEQIVNVLELLRGRDSRTPPLYLRNGSMYALTPEGKLGTGAYFRGWRESNSSFGEYLWSIAHNVRPAAQSLGVDDCTDCHAADAPIFFGRTTAAGRTEAGGPPVRLMHELRGDDATAARAWNLGFRFRPAFKWFGFGCAVVVGLILLHYVLAGIGAITRSFR